jgi:hypothetical protein
MSQIAFWSTHQIQGLFGFLYVLYASSLTLLLLRMGYLWLVNRKRGGTLALWMKYPLVKEYLIWGIFVVLSYLTLSVYSKAKFIQMDMDRSAENVELWYFPNKKRVIPFDQVKSITFLEHENHFFDFKKHVSVVLRSAKRRIYKSHKAPLESLKVNFPLGIELSLEQYLSLGEGAYGGSDPARQN